MTTLLEKATAIANPIRIDTSESITSEHIELIIAYLEGSITARQASGALGHKHPGNFTAWLGKAIKILYREGKVDIKV